MSRKVPTAWQNFIWDVEDWIANHGWFFFFALLIFIVSVSISNAHAEDLYVEAWVEETKVVEYCYVPYPSPVTLEFKAARVLVEIEYLDIGRGELVESSWYYDEETDTTICKVWIRIPDDVIGDPDMDGLGHEFLHCMIGNFHPDEETTNE